MLYAAIYCFEKSEGGELDTMILLAVSVKVFFVLFCLFELF